MTYSFDGYNYWIRLDWGESLARCLDIFMKETKIEGAWVSGLGGALGMTLGFYDLEKKAYEWRTFEGLHEVLSLQGNLAKNEAGEVMFHLHGTFGDSDFQSIGGHVKDLTAAATLELFVHRSYLPLQRKMNSEVGLETLSV